MANEEQLSILKQGIRAWNEWRKEHPAVKIDLDHADLRELDLEDVNLSEASLTLANLSGVNLERALLRRAHLSSANLSLSNLHHANLVEADVLMADLREANLVDANIPQAELGGAHLSGANLSEAILRYSNFRHADLTGTNLTGADLTHTNFTLATLSQSIFSEARLAGTVFGSNDLSDVMHLDTAYHEAPSYLGTGTLYISKGRISLAFLRGCGLSDWEIEEVKLYNPDLTNDEVNKILYRMYDLRATQALQVSPLFISYSHVDATFVEKLESKLNKKGIRFWRDVHDLKSGRLEKQIGRAIRLNPTVLLILSEHSLKSDWVEHEVRTARGLEKQMGRDVLCPVALDDSWKSSRWPKRVMEQIMEYNILDFSAWKDDSKFEIMFRKLIDGLELFYKKG